MSKFDDLNNEFDEIDSIRIALEKLIPQIQAKRNIAYKKDLEEIYYGTFDDLKMIQKEIFDEGLRSGDLDKDDIEMWEREVDLNVKKL